MSPVAGVSSSPDRAATMLPATTGMIPQGFAKDAIISWFRGEFAAANAIIDALCGHLSKLEGGRSEYESVFAAIHQRRMNWIPILQMQKYFSIADVTLELQKVAEAKTRSRGVERVEEVGVSSPVKEINLEVSQEEAGDCSGNGGGEVFDDDFPFPGGNSPKSEITDTGSQEVQEFVVNKEICTNKEYLEARRSQLKTTKGFVAKESVKGHVVNVVRGLKLHEDILNDTELSNLNDYMNELRVAGQKGELSGETFIKYNQQSKAIKRELLQFGAPIFGQIKDEAATKSPETAHIEPIPAPLEDVIDHMIQCHLISENLRPNSCIVNFFDEGEFSQPFLKPPHLEQPISTLVLSESRMAFGRTLVCDDDGNYKGSLMLSLKEGSLLVMRGNSADIARHVMCQSPSKRISVTFFKVRTDTNESSSSAGRGLTVWQPGIPASSRGPNPMEVVPKWKWGPQLVMLAPVRPRRLPRGGTGVFLPWNSGSGKPAKQLPPRAQRGRPEAQKVDPSSDSGVSVA